MRYPLIIGNWKLNGTKKIICELIKKICVELLDIKGCTVAIAPPEIYLYLVKQKISFSDIKLSAQNVDINLYGAFTGETSANMLKDIGVKYIIIGHSERRIYHKESDELIAKKLAILKSVGLVPVLCIGETENQKKCGDTKKICKRQIDSILNVQGVTAFKDTIIAYEPVWAIGTGKSATPTQAQEIHAFIRDHIAKQDTAIAKQVIIQYGGSVNEENAADLFKQPDIDGALLGGSSLKANIFATIVKAAAIAKMSIV